MLKEKAKNFILLLLFLALITLSLAGCRSDYPMLDMQLDIKEFIETCYEGSGYVLNLNEEEKVTVSAVADRLFIDEDKSQNTIEEIQSAVRNATAAGDGLTGTWKAEVDISPIIWECFEDLEGLELQQYMSGIIVPAELSFYQGGIYMLKFDKNALEKARDEILDDSVKAAKSFMASKATGAASLVIKAIDDDTIRSTLDYVVNIAEEMLKNGAAGNYSAKNGKLRFDSSNRCSYLLQNDDSGESTDNPEAVLIISEAKTGGILSVLATAEEIQFTRA